MTVDNLVGLLLAASAPLNVILARHARLRRIRDHIIVLRRAFLGTGLGAPSWLVSLILDLGRIRWAHSIVIALGRAPVDVEAILTCEALQPIVVRRIPRVCEIARAVAPNTLVVI